MLRTFRLASLSIAILFALCMAMARAAVLDHALDRVWWKHASVAEKNDTLASAIQTTQLVWMLAYSTARIDAVNAVTKSGGSDRLISAVALSSIRESPKFPRTLSFYRGAIDAYYLGHPRAVRRRITEVLLLCYTSISTSECRRLDR
jgi:hypothetical protein